MTTPTETLPEMAPVRAEVLTLPETVRHLAITDEASFSGASAILVRIKTLRATIARLWEPQIKHAFATHRALLDDRRRLDAPLLEAETLLKRKLAAFTLAEEARRAIDARRRGAEAQEARTARIWADVEQLEAAGYHEEATDLVTEWVSGPAPAIVLTPIPLKADGISCREIWRYEVVDERQVPREYLVIDHQKLGGVVRALKGAAQIPGVRIWAERTIAATGK